MRIAERLKTASPTMLQRPSRVVLLLLASALAAIPAAAATWWRLPIWGADVRIFASDP